MYRIGIDIGSTYTKYCVADESGRICNLYKEKTPLRQKAYFEKKTEKFNVEYGNCRIISCGYGRKNIDSIKNISELTALALGSYLSYPQIDTVLDIGGQDTKVIIHQGGKLLKFFINEKCAAGSGIFLENTLRMMDMDYEALNVSNISKPAVQLSSVCAVFAQSEIISLAADNVPPEIIVQGVLWQILLQAKKLLSKAGVRPILLSGGIARIPGIQGFAESALGRECNIIGDSPYLSAIGCTMWRAII